MKDLFDEDILDVSSRENTNTNDELTEYLGTSQKKIALLTFWKEHKREFPTLARVARDIFSIPATGAGVELVFNSARDVCHYRQGSLNAAKI
ncbi:unnamed protein product [Penicillium salamii]|nr:unnamed protein product [Penicillium salamii]CAG8354398.1 unnamed protein product [Penicillium salamii]